MLGASGSGKSTLLRVGLGLERRQSGVVRFRGSDTSDWSGARWQRARSEIQLLLQDPMAMLHPTLPIGYLVEESARLHRPHAPAARVAREALVHVGLADRWWATPSELSGGERRRASLARVLVAQPALLCVDEPTNGIDAARRPAVVRRLLDAIPVDGALVMVSHDVELLRWACQRFIVLDAGRIVDAFTRAMLDTLGPAARAPATQRLLGGHA